MSDATNDPPRPDESPSDYMDQESNLTVRESLELDRTALFHSNFGLTPKILDAIGRRNAKIAIDPESKPRQVASATRNVLQALKLVTDWHKMQTGAPDAVVNVVQQVGVGVALPDQLAAMDATVPLPASSPASPSDCWPSAADSLEAEEPTP